MKIKTTKLLLLFAVWLSAYAVSCNKSEGPEPELPKASFENIEIGSGNNGIGIIGRDFHFDADIVAGDKIDNVQIKIRQKANVTYTKEWSFEIEFEQYRGAKNVNVHKHFDIPEDAPEGQYDFMIIVSDQNGTIHEEMKEIELIDPANLAVNPKLYIWSIQNSNGDSYFVNETLENPKDVVFAKNDILNSNVQIKDVKDDGVMYLLLIKKKLNHFPETVNNIDFSKAIVVDVYEHKGEKEVFTFWNTPYNRELHDYERWPELVMGAARDNNTPSPNPINGEKVWENGEYYLGVVYTNTTHNLSVHHYFELEINDF